jgi:hypothetical protein
MSMLFFFMSSMVVNFMAYSLNDIAQEIDEAYSLAALANRSVFEVVPAWAVDLDLHAQVDETLQSPRIDDAKKHRLELLKAFLNEAWVEATLRNTQVADTVRFDAQRGLRQVNAQALEQKSNQHLEVWARQLDIRLQRLSQIKLSGREFCERSSPMSLALRQKQAEDFLKRTQDAYFEVLPFALRQVEATLKPATAAWHDLERACLLPSCFQFFASEHLFSALSRNVSEMFVSPNADGRLRVEVASALSQGPSSSLAVVQVPARVQLNIRPALGFEAWRQVLARWGEGLHWSHVDAGLPVVHRRLGWQNIPKANGALLALSLQLEPFLIRYAGATAKQSRDLARLTAFSTLASLRISAVKMLARQEAFLSGGFRASMPEEFAEKMHQTMHIAFSAQRFAHELASMSVSAGHTFEASALAASLMRPLQERFDQDYFRNPATGLFLKTRSGFGQQISPKEWCLSSSDDAVNSDALSHLLMAALNR